MHKLLTFLMFIVFFSCTKDVKNSENSDMKKLTVGDLIVKNQGAIKEATDKILKEEGLTAVINFCKDSLIPGRQILLTKEGMTFTLYDRGVFTIDGNGDPVKPLLNFEKEMDYSA